MFTEDEKNIIIQAKITLRHACKTFASEYPALDWNQIFLTGGAIASLIQGGHPNDYDLYFSTDGAQKTADVILTEIYNSQIKDVDPKYTDQIGVNGKMITMKAITMKSTAQFITCIYGTPADVKKTFDYVHCCPHYDIFNDTLHISRKQYDAIVNKTLIINNYGRLKTWREDKFISRGYKKSY